MGSLSIPVSGVIYLDTAPIIYTIERHKDYGPLLLPLWAALDAKAIEIVTSELTLLETLVKPLRDGDQSLIDDYEKLLTATAVRMQFTPREIVSGLSHGVNCLRLFNSEIRNPNPENYWHPSFQDLREDTSPKEVVREVQKVTEYAQSALLETRCCYGCPG